MEEKRGYLEAVIFFFLFLGWGVILGRSFDLMVIRRGYYQLLARENRLRELKIAAVRGKIVTLKGEVLAEDRVGWRDEKGRWLTKDEMLERKIKGEVVDEVIFRFYPPHEAAAHLTGYLGKVTQEELGGFRCQERRLKYGLTDWVGRMGLEEEYDCYLAGREGRRLVELDARGRIVREIGRVKPEKGRNIVVSLDLELQERIFSLIKGKKAAVVVLSPTDGRVLALVSSPSFDPNSFGFKGDEERVKRWLTDRENFPLVNRAISVAYHPGSVFKIITALAGLEEGKITAETLVEDVGIVRIGDWEFGNWYYLEYGRKEGMVDLVKAIKRSNDIYFYKVGEWLGAEKLAEWAERFGWGKKTGIDLPGEEEGLVPSPEWKKKIKKERWFLGNTYHFAIGQGDLTATPLQVAAMTAVVANGGKWCRPHLLVEVEGEERGKRKEECSSLGISLGNIELVRKGMVEACQPGGTGFPFFNFQPPVACKTGTAEVGDGSGDSHAWFTLFAPVENPRVVVTVLVERGGSGAYVAAPIAKEIIDYLKERGDLSGE